MVPLWCVSVVGWTPQCFIWTALCCYKLPVLQKTTAEFGVIINIHLNICRRNKSVASPLDKCAFLGWTVPFNFHHCDCELTLWTGKDDVFHDRQDECVSLVCVGLLCVCPWSGRVRRVLSSAGSGPGYDTVFSVVLMRTLQRSDAGCKSRPPPSFPLSRFSLPLAHT